MQFYFKITSRGQKYGGFFLNCAKISQIILCWKSWLWVWVDCKMESVLGYSRKNPKDKNGKRLLEFLDLSLYPCKFQTKWSSTPGNSMKLCYTHWNFRSKTKKQDPWKFHIIFSGSPLPFFIDPWNFHILFLNNPGTLPCHQCFME